VNRSIEMLEHVARILGAHDSLYGAHRDALRAHWLPRAWAQGAAPGTSIIETAGEPILLSLYNISPSYPSGESHWPTPA
jgi:hypothetical protein